jgi:hypothetical protein
MGTLQFVTGAVVKAMIGPFADGTARPMVIGIAGCDRGVCHCLHHAAACAAPRVGRQSSLIAADQGAIASPQ